MTNRQNITLLVCSIFISSFKIESSASLLDAEKLMTSLFNSTYHTELRPVMDQSQAIDVNIQVFCFESLLCQV